MSEVLSERGKKFIEYIAGNYDEQINLHVDKKTDVVWKEKIQDRFKRSGMKTTPHAGIFVVNVSEIVTDTFWNDGERLGINPADYSIDRLKKMCVAVRKVDTDIEEVVKVRDKTVKQIDNEYTRKLQAMISK